LDVEAPGTICGVQMAWDTVISATWVDAQCRRGWARWMWQTT